MLEPLPRLGAGLRVDYVPAARALPLPARALAGVCFGPGAPPRDPRLLRVALRPLEGEPPVECWQADREVAWGVDGALRHVDDGLWQLGEIELDERDHGGLETASENAYRMLEAFRARSGYPHLLRVWNYLDAINAGTGDEERYRRFCVGRARGLGPAAQATLPAATAIGRRDASPLLQVYWLAARTPGRAIENPRQVSAYRYPRCYGPQPPSFSRAMLHDDRLMISGTASVVGHASRHPGDVIAQLDETLANLDAVLERAHALAPAVPRRFGPGSVLKVYLRDAAHAALVRARLDQALPASVRTLLLEGDVCREELLLEIDGWHAAG